MFYDSDLFNLILAGAVLVIGVGIFIKISRSLRRGGGSMTTTMLGSTYLFHDQEKRKAIEVIVEKKAGKRQEGQHSEDPDSEPETD